MSGLNRLAGVVVIASALAGGSGMSGCGSASGSKGEHSTSVLELSVRVATLDLSNLNRRLTRVDVTDLWSVMKREKVEILTVQNLTRYPGLSTRVDLINEFARVSGWRSVFGELVDNSGRQNGNAVFSLYPIRSNATVSFHTVEGAVFEGALQTVIDGGVREITVVSAKYPEKGGDRVRNECRTLIAKERGNPAAPMILSGSNPEPREGWEEVFPAKKPVGLQYEGLGAVKLLESRIVTSKLGKISLASFGLYRNQ